MAADQRKKRPNAASLTGCTSLKLCGVNKKKLRVQKHDLNVRPNISLEWDNKKKSVVSKREQIGIKRRHLNRFLEPGVPCHNILADAFSVPQDLFDLENISEVLSYEVWQNHLSDNERRFLSQFLPNVSEPDIIVQDLLSGDNFHFGNPCVKWGASLCHGELHPDNILHEEQSLRAGKKVYYSDLQKYHSGMIENLRTWKEKWANCKDPEVDIVQNIWSSRQHDKRSLPSLENRFHANEDNLVATPESCSWTNSEMACSNDNQNPDTAFGDSHRRNGLLGKIFDNSSSGPMAVAAVSKKVEHLHKHNIEHVDGAKYMSYIKVSREQRERVKSSMKHASNSIHLRSLNSVFGIDALNAQPYENFLDEEKKKLHQHWLKLATEDIPESVANWGKRRLQRKEFTLSLVEEIGQKLECQTILDEEREGSQNKQMELSDDNEEILPPITFEGLEIEQSNDLLPEQDNCREANHEMETNAEDEKEGGNSDYLFEESTHVDLKMMGDESSIIPDQVFIEDDNQEQIALLNDTPGFHYQQKMDSLNSNNATGCVPDQYMPEQAASLVDLQGKDVGNGSFFNSYPHFHDRNELLHSLFKGPSNNSAYHHHQQKHPGLVFQPGNDNLMEAGHFREQVHPALPLDLGQKRRPSDNLYPNHHNIHEWTSVSDTASMPQPHLSQNCWYNNSNAGVGVDNGTTQDGWLPSLSDQTLFSVLSECNELPPQVGSYASSGSSGIGSSNFLQQSSSSYLNGHHEIARMNDNHLGWTGVVQPQQNSGIRDSSFLRSRNQ